MRNVLRNLLTAGATALVMLAPAAWGQGQEAGFTESRVAQRIYQCLSAGLPLDWERAFVILELTEPLATSGEVRYVVQRRDSNAPEIFQPCDGREPVDAILATREAQSPDKRGWVAARAVFSREGKFEFNYDYP